MHVCNCTHDHTCNIADGVQCLDVSPRGIWHCYISTRVTTRKIAVQAPIFWPFMVTRRVIRNAPGTTGRPLASKKRLVRLDSSKQKFRTWIGIPKQGGLMRSWWNNWDFWHEFPRWVGIMPCSTSWSLSLQIITWSTRNPTPRHVKIKYIHIHTVINRN